MPKIKKIRELKPRIREIKPKEESELIEDIEEAETIEQQQAADEFENVSEFEAPSLILETNLGSAETQTTQIQRATRERRELDEQGAVYTTMHQSQDNRKDYLSPRDYTSSEYNTVQQLPEQRTTENQNFRREQIISRQRIGDETQIGLERETIDNGAPNRERQYRKRQRE